MTRKIIIIAATQRCGSSMLCEDLDNAGFGKPNEWFNSWSMPNDRPWQSELSLIQAKGTANDIFAAKIMANQMGIIDARLASFITPSFPAPFAHVRTVMDGALWLWNRRRDIVDQAISRYVASQRDVYHTIRGRNGFVPGKAVMQGKSLPEPEYNFEQIKREVDAVKEHDAIWARFFEKHEIEPIVLWYEDVTDGSSVVAVSNALGIEPITSGQRNLTKLPANDKLKRRFMNDLSEVPMVVDFGSRDGDRSGS